MSTSVVVPSDSTVSAKTPSTQAPDAQNISRRVNGKNWHETKKPFRQNAGLTSYAKRAKLREETAAVKKLEREMKEEKAAQREAWIQGIKEKRARKEERERYERMEEKMHKKRVERVKRREKRNKLLGK